uniref:Carn_acyltransf domain-containing protein n=1 Tax=Panagrellus redivivus TaxID=6233 RepID=A0A7E4UPP6_PANRE
MTRQKSSKAAPPPFPMNGSYPGHGKLALIDFYNGIYNRLFPVRPIIFAASTSAAAAYFYQHPNSTILNLLPNLLPNSEAFQYTKLALASLATAYVPVFLLRRFLKHFIFSYKGFLFEKKPSFLTKFWAICRKVLVRSPILNSCDALLPNLPLPGLKDTVERYLESVKPLMTADEYAALSEIATKFLSEEGPKLQMYARLLHLFQSNYVTPFWEKYAYLMNREQLMISSSVAHVGLFNEIPANQAVRTAHVIHIEALSMLAIAKQQLKPLGDGLVCSQHYHRMYAATRVPGEEIDHFESGRISRHVVLYSKGCFYKLVIFDENNKLLSPDKLTELVTDILFRDDAPLPGEDRLAALTFDQRTKWNENRERFFLDNPTNAAALEAIEEAMVFMSLDEEDDYGYDPENPEKLDAFLKSMLTGNGKNRWVDKSLNYIVSKNGRAGGTTEHAIGDGAEFDHIMENFVAADINFLQYPEYTDLDTVDKASWKLDSKLQPAERLSFEITPPMEAEIERCYEAYQPKRADIEFAATVFTDWGKGLIKKGKCSPDAFVQMAIQLANFKDQGKFSLTYESASARFYANSRTETLRTVSPDSCAFVNAMLDPASTDVERLRLLRKACEVHGLRNRECMVGRGVDRHLFVLYVLSRGVGVSSPFLDHYLSQPWLLSTSQPPTLTTQVNEDERKQFSWLGACFAPVAKDGYGVCYRFAGNHSICAHITSFQSSPVTSAHRFQKHLVDVFNDMARLFENVDGVKA